MIDWIFYNAVVHAVWHNMAGAVEKTVGDSVSEAVYWNVCGLVDGAVNRVITGGVPLLQIQKFLWDHGNKAMSGTVGDVAFSNSPHPALNDFLSAAAEVP